MAEGDTGDRSGAETRRDRGEDGFGTAEPVALPRPHGTIPALDGFRAIAIVIVMLSHVGLAPYVPGQFGVTLFFFLSGYLITTLLRRELDEDGKVSFRAFYLRRAVRIIPPMWVAICLAIVFSALGLNHALNPEWLPADFAFLSNYFQYSSVPIGLWSLAVEEHFYLLFPVAAIALTARRGPRACAVACALVCLLVLGIRAVEFQRLADPADIAFFTHTRLDSILFGAILALWNNPVIDAEDRLPDVLPAYVIGGALLAISFLVRDEAFRFTLRYTVQGVGLILIFNAAIRDTRIAHRLLENAPLKWIGVLSYLLYLVHGIFLEAAEPLAPMLGNAGAIIAGLAVAFAASYALHIHLERPLARWRRGVERGWRAAEELRAAPQGQSPGGAP